MKSLKFYAEKGLVLEKVPKPTCEEGDVLVRVLAASICGSDLRVIKGKKRIKRDGVTLGHEIFGVVAESRNPHVKEGSFVTLFPSIFCGKCENCSRGSHNLCKNKLSFGSAIDGGFAEYLLVPRKLIELNGVAEVEGDKVFCLSEPFACVLHSFETLGVEEGKLLIVGAGSLGLMHLLVACIKGLGATIVDPHPERLDMARSIHPEALTLQSIEDVKEDHEASVLCAFSPETIQHIISKTKDAGCVSLFAGGSWERVASFIPNDLHYREVKLTGTHSTRVDLFHRAVELIKSEKIREKLKRIITHTFPLEKHKEAFETYEKREGIKVLFTP